MVRNYTEYRSLHGIYLEDGYVLDIVESASEIRFVLEAVLMPEHALYRTPMTGEWYCYAEGALVFGESRDIEWLKLSFKRYKDAAGIEDWGNIDSLTDSDGVYTAVGDWGGVRIRSGTDPEFIISDSWAK
ncbi:hypothetical protein DFR70_103368 [Nocardia tenerifensis]|uniref:Uncharacterized protein n=1 Tax=Nocardia tenerifensis TaxID=228006 RepID=A0A318K4S8_9NOCA|nr:hypothetical protein [Nocardia tenerifensis]PXX66619.1 hypothetical protein DFR70_103368 [Nocardia tenerifensis]